MDVLDFNLSIDRPGIEPGISLQSAVGVKLEMFAGIKMTQRQHFFQVVELDLLFQALVGPRGLHGQQG